jgi:hypothetical protein
MDARVTSAFTRVFDALCPRMTQTRGSIRSESALAALAPGLERAQFRFFLGKQLLDHRPLGGIDFRGKQLPVVVNVEASNILR